MTIFVLFLLMVTPVLGQTAESLDFLAGLPDFREVRRMLPEYLNRQALAKLEEREREIARLATQQDVAKRRGYLRDRMIRALGGLPADRTPLNARTVVVLDRDGYKIEKIIFESQPRFYVTANLYLPKNGTPPYPAILYPLGHEAGAKAHGTWQQMLVTLARRGYVALAWDPLGQGERVQLFDPDSGESKVIRSTTEHTVLGIQCLLVGDNVARYTIWDGMRALDYLLSRKEVDPKRVACTGNSGGGTHTAYLSALDDRIHVAAPSCYITSWRRLVQSIGPQDAEQCIPPWISDGLDHGDFILAFAPKPYLMLSAIRDFFSISGARETFQEARGVYERIGAAEKIKMVEADDGHGYSQPRRLAAYQWFARWLKGSEDNQAETPVEPEDERTLFATETGQVATSLGGESVHSLNLKRFEQAKASRKPLAGAALQAKLRELLRFEPRREPLKVQPFGVITRTGYRIEKLIYDSEPGVRVPALLFLPDRAGRMGGVIYVHGRGKSAGMGPGGEIERLVRAGRVVLAIDARGFGETRFESPSAGSDFPRYFGDYHSAMKALLLGKPLAGMRAEDIHRGVDLLAARAEVNPDEIHSYGQGAGAIPALYQAALDPRVKQVTLDGMLVSYESVVRGRLHRDVFENVVQGALRHYDLPDLVAALAPRTVWVLRPVNPLGQPVPLGEAQKLYERTGAKIAGRPAVSD